MEIKLTSDDCKKLEENYPLLNCDLKNQRVWGTFQFSCFYDAKNKQLVHDEQADDCLSDIYEIEINFQKSDPFDLPRVIETSEKIVSFAKMEKIRTGDLHLYNDGSCCLGVEYDYEWVDACKFIDDRITSFFFWQTYRRKFGSEPWEGYPHGSVGRIQGGIDSIKRIDKRINKISKRIKGKNRNILCPCGSKNKYKKCCFYKDKKSLVELKEKRKDLIEKIDKEIEDLKDQ